MTASQKRARIAELRSRGLSYSEIEREVGLCKATIAYHCRRLGLPADDTAARRYDWGEIQTAYDTGLSVRECMRRFGFSSASWHKAVERNAIKPRPSRTPLAELLVDGRPTHRCHLRARLIDEGLKEDRCERCGLRDWQEAPISLQLHHRNGRGLDNRLENLELLCPNCHTQTENWGARNRAVAKAA
jgi:hypothetical protein